METSLLEQKNSRNFKNELWFCYMDFKEVASILETNIEHGLNLDQIEGRRKKYGSNEIPRMRSPSAFKIFFRQFYDFMILILFLAAITSAFIQDWIEAGALLLVVIINTLIGFVQEYRAEKALAALETLTVPTAMVIRGGTELEIQTSELTIGDIVLLEEGNAVPADIRLTEAINLEIDEAILTGESEPVEKRTEPIFQFQKSSRRNTICIGDVINCCFMNTTITKGHGKGIVVRIGRKTEVGKISKTLNPQRSSTALQEKLKRLGKQLVILSILLCALIAGVGILQRYFRKGNFTLDDLHDLLKIAISLAVSVIPEGLIAVVTVTMALGVQRMANRNAVVRKLPAIETLGSVTVICTDKTGTLTEGKMIAEELWNFGSDIYKITGKGIIPEGKLFLNKTEVDLSHLPKSLYLSLATFALCNNSRIQKDPSTEEWISFGDPTEVALQVAAHKVQHGKEYFKENNFTFISEAAFDSERKRMSTVYSGNDGVYILSKGAVESIESICRTIISTNNKIAPLSKEMTDKIHEIEGIMGSRGLRVLALAFKEISKEKQEIDPEELEQEQDLIFLGLVGILDPPREQVKNAVHALKQAGISVCMITGDHPQTAFAIAKRLSIIEKTNTDWRGLLTGKDLAQMTVENLASLENFPRVFARVNPKHKLNIVKALKLRREISAMIGDGVNDAPAIQKADVGVAMGKSGTDLAKEAASIVLMDDNFSTILAAIEEGRRTYDNIYKFIIYLLSCNSSEIYVMLFATIVGLPIPFTAVMILWQNLVVDIGPAISLGIDPPEAKMLSRKPRDPNSPILTRTAIFTILIYGLFMAGLTLGLFSFVIYVWGYEIGESVDSPNHARGITFMNLAVLHLVHSFLARAPQTTFFSKLTWENYWLIASVLLSLIVNILVLKKRLYFFFKSYW